MVSKIYNSSYRNLVVGVDKKVPLDNGSYVTGINFDNAATTPPFYSVLEEIMKFAPWYSSIHRGTGFKSQISSGIYEKSRIVIGNFVGADLNNDVIIFVKNTTEAINKLANKLHDYDNKSVVLCTKMDHHSNDLPWRDKYEVHYVDIDKCGRLDLNSLEDNLIKYKGRVKLVSVVGASNVTGYINPIHEIASIVHEHDSKILVDGAQLVPHSPVNMKPATAQDHIDYLAFSGHKMYAPFGTGVLIGPKKSFLNGPPDYSGGGTVKIVSEDFVLWDDPPEKEEAGTPNLMGVVALVASINTLSKLGMHNIELYENSLLNYALDKIRNIGEIDLYCSNDDKFRNSLTTRVSIIPFNIRGVHHETTANLLSAKSGIAVRNGCFCAQPYVQKLLNISKDEMIFYAENYDSHLKRPGMVRLSFSLYNTYEEIDTLIYALKKIIKFSYM